MTPAMPPSPADAPSPTQKWMSNLVIVRHGESERNVARQAAVTGGHPEYGGEVRDADVTLTERGITQAEFTGKFLAREFRFDRVFVSPYVRAVQTAEILVRQFAEPMTMTTEERVREKEFGVIDGLTARGLRERYPDELRRRKLLGKYYYRPPGGESYPDIALRLHSFLGTLTRDFRRKSVLVVCHSIIVLTFRRLLERLSERELLAIDADPSQDVRNCSVTWYQFDSHAGDDGKLVLREFNRVHYPD